MRGSSWLRHGAHQCPSPHSLPKVSHLRGLFSFSVPPPYAFLAVSNCLFPSCLSRAHAEMQREAVFVGHECLASEFAKLFLFLLFGDTAPMLDLDVFLFENAPHQGAALWGGLIFHGFVLLLKTQASFPYSPVLPPPPSPCPVPPLPANPPSKNAA